MKILYKHLFAVLVLFLAFSIAALGANKISVGGRTHAKHSTFTEIPYENGDMSYNVAYEYHDASGMWQLGLDYTPTVSGTNNIEYVLTPQLNLIFRDKSILVGVGILHSYVEYSDDDADWLTMYWQFITGFTMPLGQTELIISAYYIFEDWKFFDEFDLGDMDYGFSLGFAF